MRPVILMSIALMLVSIIMVSITPCTSYVALHNENLGASDILFDNYENYELNTHHSSNVNNVDALWIYQHGIAGRILRIDVSKGLLAKYFKELLIHPYLATYVHAYAYVGKEIIELPIRIYNDVEMLKVGFHKRLVNTVKLYVIDGSVKRLYIDVKLPPRPPLCVERFPLNQLGRVKVLRVLEVRFSIDYAGDPIVQQIIELINAERHASTYIVKEFTPLRVPIGNTRIALNDYCVYLVIDNLSNPYVVWDSIEFGNIASTFDTWGLSLFISAIDKEVPSQRALRYLRAIVDTPVRLSNLEVRDVYGARNGTFIGLSNATYLPNVFGISAPTPKWVGVNEVNVTVILGRTFTKGGTLNAISFSDYVPIALEALISAVGINEKPLTYTSITLPITSTSLVHIPSQTSTTPATSTRSTTRTSTTSQPYTYPTSTTYTKSSIAPTSTSSTSTKSSTTSTTTVAPGICLKPIPRGCRYFILFKDIVGSSNNACMLDVRVKIFDSKGDILMTYEGTYPIIPYVLNYVLNVVPINSAMIKYLANFNGLLYANYLIRVRGCNDMNISLDKVTLLYVDRILNKEWYANQFVEIKAGFEGVSKSICYNMYRFRLQGSTFCFTVPYYMRRVVVASLEAAPEAIALIPMYGQYVSTLVKVSNVKEFSVKLCVANSCSRYETGGDNSWVRVEHYVPRSIVAQYVADATLVPILIEINVKPIEHRWYTICIDSNIDVRIRAKPVEMARDDLGWSSIYPPNQVSGPKLSVVELMLPSNIYEDSLSNTSYVYLQPLYLSLNVDPNTSLPLYAFEPSSVNAIIDTRISTSGLALKLGSIKEFVCVEDRKSMEIRGVGKPFYHVYTNGFVSTLREAVQAMPSIVSIAEWILDVLGAGVPKFTDIFVGTAVSIASKVALQKLSPSVSRNHSSTCAWITISPPPLSYITQEVTPIYVEIHGNSTEIDVCYRIEIANTDEGYKAVMSICRTFALPIIFK